MENFFGCAVITVRHNKHKDTIFKKVDMQGVCQKGLNFMVI